MSNIYRNTNEFPNLRTHYLILDLDHTLIHALEMEHWQEKGYVQGDFEINIGNHQYMVYKRPYLDEFLEFCFKKYKHVIIWSAGTEDYVHQILHNILKREQEPLYVISRDTYDTRRKDIDNLLDMIFTTEHRIVFIDDIPRRIDNLSDKHIIRAQPFHIQCERIRPDRFLLDLMDHLEL